MELDWQNKFREIKDRVLYLLQSEKLSDCHFLVGAPSNQRLLAGHKLVLAMASPMFERMFYGSLPEKSDPIPIPDLDPDAFQAMLEYIYSDCINISSFDEACGLYYVAKKYLLPHVAEECIHFLLAALSPQNACRAYEFAKFVDEPRLMKSSMNIIAANTYKVLADPSFTDIEVSTLMTILGQDRLDIDSELDLFNALVKYATAHGVFSDDQANTVPQPNAVDLHKEAPVDVESIHDRGNVKKIKLAPDVPAMMHNREDEDVSSHLVDDVVVGGSNSSRAKSDGGRKRSASPSSALTNDMNSSMDAQRVVIDEVKLRQALEKIRFLTLTPQQFAGGPARSKLLQQHEVLAILMNISCPNLDDCPLPEGLCSSRCSRVYNRVDSQPLPTRSSFGNYGNESIGQCSFITAADYRNTSVTVCSFTFEVNRDVCITGVKVPTQSLANSPKNYTEELCAQIQDIQGSQLTYTRCTPTVSYYSDFTINFKDRVCIKAHQKYKLFVMFYKKGVYPMYKCTNSSGSQFMLVARLLNIATKMTVGQAKQLDYRNKLILAPMVRVGTLPMRLLALEFGADIVYTEELIDRKLMKSRRRLNAVLGTVDFVDPSDGTIIFRTCAKERDQVVLQLGTSDAQRALAVGKLVQADVAALDINMGCPKEFSIKGGMGVALLAQPDKAVQILSTLCQGLSIPVTCKIRILPTLEDTIEMVKRFAATGIAAIAIHARTRDERPQHEPHPDFIREIAKAVDIPVIANGGSREIQKYADIRRFRDVCGASSVMVARAAQLNVSIFRKEGLLPMDDIICKYLKLSVDYDNAAHNTKYGVQNILKELQETPRGKQFLQCQTLQQMCEIWHLGDYCYRKQLEFKGKGYTGRREVVPEPFTNGDTSSEGCELKRRKLEAPPLDVDVIEENIAFLRSNYNSDTLLPKTVLYTYAHKNGKDNPSYETQRIDKLFRAICSFDGKQYTSSFWEKNKKQAEQGAALVCLLRIGVVAEQDLIRNGSILS